MKVPHNSPPTDIIPRQTGALFPRFNFAPGSDSIMTSFYRIEIDGDAQNCAKFINELRLANWNLSLDREGYLIASEAEWADLVSLAAAYQCEVKTVGLIQQAA